MTKSNLIGRKAESFIIIFGCLEVATAENTRSVSAKTHATMIMGYGQDMKKASTMAGFCYLISC